jgi:chemotaxis protein CheX
MISAASSQHEKILTAFIQAILRYFDQITGISAQTETPYLQKGPSEIMDVTGIIGLSGDTQGCVYFTSPEEKLNNLLAFIGERDISDELRCDIAGEIANTFAGNARRILGPGFMIAVPLVILGKPERIVWPKETETFVIPIIWQQMRSLLIICLGGKPLPPNAHFHTRAEEDMETEID